VALTTNPTSSAGTTAAIYISSTITTAGSLDLRDNVFANEQTIGTRYAIYCAATNAVFSFIDWNDYWPGTGTLGYLGAAQGTLALWQAATLKDENSISQDPLFTSATNLQPQIGSPVINGGFPVGITTDILGELRDPDRPSIGAYEDPFALDLSVTKTDSPDPVVAGSNITYEITVTNNGPAVAINPTLTDSTPAGTTFVSLSAAAGWSCTAPAVGGTGAISCSTATLASGSSAVFTLVVRVNYCVGNTTTTNTATVTNDVTDIAPANNTASEITTILDSGACDDGNACTTGDHCEAGVCVASGGCYDGNPCTTDECVLTPTPHCEYPAIACDTPPDVCHVAPGTCNWPGLGVCEYPNAPDTTACNDGDLCTVNDQCTSGACAGTAKDCNDNNFCTDDSCNPVNGNCVHANKAEGTTCDDSNACTVDDVCGGGFAEDFDRDTAPALPSGWTTTVTPGTALAWETVTDYADTAPNAAWAQDATAVTDNYLDSPSIYINSATAQLTFMKRVDLESGFDGAVLEIKIGAGSFQDIKAAGGTIPTGDYNGTISTSYSSPIAGRSAWTGAYLTFTTTIVNLPAAAQGQWVVLRWRVASDSSFGNTGFWIDSIVLSETSTCNGTPGNAGATCRAAGGFCDIAEVCDGTNAACPADVFVPLGTECRAPAGLCDVPEFCTGAAATCPADAFASPATLCRLQAGDCDVPDYCTGAGPACPADAKSTAECRASAGDCDIAENCNGASNDCPADAFEPPTLVCRPSTAPCDPAETCTGSSATCPADVAGQSNVVGSSVALSHDKGTNTTTISWTEAEAGPFDVYRGFRNAGSAFTFNHTCFDPLVPGPSVTDTDTPAPGQVFYYLISRKDPACAESSLGLQSNGSERPNSSPCGAKVVVDADLDGVPEAYDNCPQVSNTDQADLDGDGIGDVCDRDMDNDGSPNDVDNCPTVYNPDQADDNHNGVGDACESAE